jgi:hypothetical protein
MPQNGDRSARMLRKVAMPQNGDRSARMPVLRKVAEAPDALARPKAAALLEASRRARCGASSSRESHDDPMCRGRRRRQAPVRGTDDQAPGPQVASARVPARMWLEVRGTSQSMDLLSTRL